MNDREPVRPSDVSPYARACLEALACTGLGRNVAIGGAFGLAHYLEYRPTRDLDAWWTDAATPEERARTLAAIEEALRPFGEIRRRSWGDVASVDLVRAGRIVFSFEVARRSARLATPKHGPWPGVAVDALEDLIAAKMSALVERGAPRDLRDIYTVCERGLADAVACWELWERRARAAGEDPDRARAALAVRSHLARLARIRPLSSIADAAARESARRVREWFVKELLRDLPG